MNAVLRPLLCGPLILQHEASRREDRDSAPTLAQFQWLKEKGEMLPSRCSLSSTIGDQVNDLNFVAREILVRSVHDAIVLFCSASTEHDGGKLSFRREVQPPIQGLHSTVIKVV